MDNMENIMDEAHALLQCRDCPWYKTCVLPMKFSVEDIRRQIAPNLEAASELKDRNTDELIASIASAAQASLLEGCPVFISRLRSSPRLAQRIKEMMQHWSEEEP